MEGGGTPETREEAIRRTSDELQAWPPPRPEKDILGALYDTAAVISGHKANEIVNRQGMTRLEAAEAERREAQQNELKRHRESIERENERHRHNLEQFDIVFRQRLFIA